METEGIKLDEQFFKKHFADIRLGVRDPDQCTDEEILAGAIPQIWAKEVEREFQEALYWAKFIGTGKYPGVVLKNELIRQPGDRIYINRLNQLTATGVLGTTHTLEGNEEQIALGDRVALQPERVGNAVCWPIIMERKLNWSIRAEARTLLAEWAASRVDTQIMTEARTTTNILFAGTATSALTITATDTLAANDLTRAMISLNNNKAKPVDGATGEYVALVHPFQLYDLLQDPDWVQAARFDDSKRIWAGYVGTYMGVDVLKTGQVNAEANEASPAVTVYDAIVFGARALAIAWGLPWTWREKISSYGEQAGVGIDAWKDEEILNEDYLFMIQSAATSPA